MEAVSDHNDEIISLAAQCSVDPQAWVDIAYDWGNKELANYKCVRAWQRETNEIIKNHLSNPDTRFTPCRIAVASGHGIGKSAEIGMLINWAMSTCDDCKVVVTANTESQLRTKTAPEISKWQKLSITADWFKLKTESIYSADPEHKDSWKTDFVTWSKENTEAFAGLHNQGKRIVLIFDEASAIDDKVWEVAEGAMTDENTEIIWIAFGNPTRNTGRFRECFRKFRHRWHTRQIDSRTVEGTNKAELEKWAEDYGEESDFFKIRVRGLFPNASAKQFISEADIASGYGKVLKPEQYNFAPIILTVDPAWEGDDEFVIGMRQGLFSTILRTIRKNDNDITMAKIIADLEDEYHADAVFIDGGYGTGIVSAGRTWGRNWRLVWFSGESGDIGCLNKRAEMYKACRDWLKAGGIIPEDPVLRDQLQAPETVPRSDGLIQIESKKEMKKRLGSSPDRADALILSFAYPVVKKDPLDKFRKTESRRDYNPYQ